MHSPSPDSIGHFAGLVSLCLFGLFVILWGLVGIDMASKGLNINNQNDYKIRRGGVRSISGFYSVMNRKAYWCFKRGTCAYCCPCYPYYGIYMPVIILVFVVSVIAQIAIFFYRVDNFGYGWHETVPFAFNMVFSILTVLLLFPLEAGNQKVFCFGQEDGGLNSDVTKGCTMLLHGIGAMSLLIFLPGMNAIIYLVLLCYGHTKLSNRLAFSFSVLALILAAWCTYDKHVNNELADKKGKLLALSEDISLPAEDRERHSEAISSDIYMNVPDEISATDHLRISKSIDERQFERNYVLCGVIVYTGNSSVVSIWIEYWLILFVMLLLSLLEVKKVGFDF